MVVASQGLLELKSNLKGYYVIIEIFKDYQSYNRMFFVKIQFWKFKKKKKNIFKSLLNFFKTVDFLKIKILETIRAIIPCSAFASIADCYQTRSQVVNSGKPSR